MIDPRWDVAWMQAYAALTEAWEYRLVLGGIIAAVCEVFGMSAVLVYAMFVTLTADMAFRLFVLIKHSKRNRHVSICRGLKKGMPRYMHYLTFILLSWGCQLTINQFSGLKVPFIDVVIAYLVLQDISSILGSLRVLGWKTPAVLVRALTLALWLLGKKADALFGVDNATPPPGGYRGNVCPARTDHDTDAACAVPPQAAREPYTPAEHPHRRHDDPEYLPGAHRDGDRGEQ